MQFQRTIGTWGLLFAAISGVIGSGWLFGPLFAAQIAGPAAIVSWLVGGCLMILISLTFAELGSAFPLTGGLIQYAEKSHGPLISFMIGWMVWISSIAVAPIETMSLIYYAANYIPALTVKTANTHHLTSIGILASAFVMLIMCTLNYYGALFFSQSNNLITGIKLIVPIMTVFILILFNFHLSNFTSSSGFAPYGWHGIFAALPLGGVIYSFLGANAVLQLAGEVKNPQRTIPLALIGSMLFCMALYTLLQIVFIGALDPQAFSQGWNKLHYAGDNGPFTGIVAAMGFAWFIIVIYADAMISPFGTGYVYTASTARVSWGLSEIGFLPEGLKKLTKKGVPLRCIIVNYILGLLLFLPFPVWQKLAGFIISSSVISYIIGPISLMVLRKKEPHVSRPFLLPYANIISFVAFYVCNLLIFWTGWDTISKMMIALFIGFIYYAYHNLSKRNKWQEHWRSSWWIVPYLVALTFISYLGTFGEGKNIIPFGVDFIVIAILTLITWFFIFVETRDEKSNFS